MYFLKNYKTVLLCCFTIILVSCKSTKKSEYQPNIPEGETTSYQQPTGDDMPTSRTSQRTENQFDNKRTERLNEMAETLGLDDYQTQKFQSIHKSYMNEVRNMRSR